MRVAPIVFGRCVISRVCTGKKKDGGSGKEKKGVAARRSGRR